MQIHRNFSYLLFILRIILVSSIYQFCQTETWNSILSWGFHLHVKSSKLHMIEFCGMCKQNGRTRTRWKPRLWLIILCFRAGPWESFIRLPVCLSPLWLITSGRARAFWIIKWASSSLPTHTGSLLNTWVCQPGSLNWQRSVANFSVSESFAAGELISWMGWCQVSVFDSSVFGN